MADIKGLADFGFNPMQAGQMAMQMQQMDLQGSRIKLQEQENAIQMKRLEQAKAREDTDNKIKAGAEMLKNGGLNFDQKLAVTNTLAEVMGIPKKWTKEEYTYIQGFADDFFDTYTRLGPNNETTREAAYNLRKKDPDLWKLTQSQAQSQAGGASLIGRATGRPGTPEEAQFLNDHKEAVGPLATQAFRYEEERDAKVEKLTGQATEANAHAKYFDAQASLRDGRAALMASITARQGAGLQKDLAMVDNLKADTATKDAKRQEILRKGDWYKDFEATKEKSLQAATQQEATYRTELEGFKRQLRMAPDQESKDRVSQQINARELLLRANEAEQRWLKNPIPEHYRLYQQADEAVNKELERASTTAHRYKTEAQSLRAQAGADKHAKDYQSMYEKTIKVAGVLSGEQIGGISISQGEGGTSDIQIGGQVKDPVKLGKTILAEVNEQDWLPAPVKASLTRLGQRLAAGEKKPEAAPAAAAKPDDIKGNTDKVTEAVDSIRKRLGLK